MTDAMLQEIASALEHRRPCTAASLQCPRCENAPLDMFRRYELVTAVELRWCARCHGFWAAGDALARGVSDPYVDHPALRAMPAPDRCKDCLGYYDAEGKCRKCGQPRPVAQCPCCLQAMKAARKGNLALDMCEPCTGTWFDIGEITATFEIPPVQGLAASTVDDDGPTNGELLREALRAIVGMFLPVRF
jgi:Zn-finger nucleic acid-binding protein